MIININKKYNMFVRENGITKFMMFECGGKEKVNDECDDDIMLLNHLNQCVNCAIYYINIGNVKDTGNRRIINIIKDKVYEFKHEDNENDIDPFEDHTKKFYPLGNIGNPLNLQQYIRQLKRK